MVVNAILKCLNYFSLSTINILDEMHMAIRKIATLSSRSCDTELARRALCRHSSKETLLTLLLRRKPAGQFMSRILPRCRQSEVGAYHSTSTHLRFIKPFAVSHANRTKDGNPKTGSECVRSHLFVVAS